MPINKPTTKRCSRCGKVKILSQFHKSRLHSLGVQSWCKFCVAEYAGLNPDKNKRAVVKYRLDHPERRRNSTREWARTHPENGCAKTARYCARKIKAILGDQELVARVYARATELRRWFDVEVDHIVALVNGGAHSADNLQIIYAQENRIKGARLNYQPSAVFT
jgi:5-methylcytosine-specific restriction endonuclease McrA